MTGCCAYGCHSNDTKDRKQGISFHKFPLNPTLRKLWTLAIRRKNWQPSRSTRICSKHFREDQLDRHSAFKVRIKDNEVPCIFPGFPSQMQKKRKQRTPQQRLTSANTTNFVPEDESSDLLQSSTNVELSASTLIETNHIYPPNDATVQDVMNSILDEICSSSVFPESVQSSTNMDLTTVQESNHTYTPNNATVQVAMNSISEVCSSSDFPASAQSNTNIDLTTVQEINHTYTQNNTIVQVAMNSTSEKVCSSSVFPECVHSSVSMNLTTVQETNHLVTIYELKRQLEKAKERIKNYQKRLRIAQQSNRRMKKKLLTFSAVIENLQKEQFLEHGILDGIKQRIMHDCL